MGNGKLDLKGSKSRDAFKHWHKQLGRSFYATDIDFAFVAKWPGNPKKHYIVAIVDYKQGYDCVSFTEAIFYNACVQMKIPVYIIISDYNSDTESFGLFAVQRYIWCDPGPDPPACEFVTVLENGTKDDYWMWEYNLRNRRAMEVIHGHSFNEKD